MRHYYQNKVIWISGASSGIGEALVYKFIKQGAKLVISARRKAELERVKNNCGALSENCWIVPLDITETTKFTEISHSLIRKFGKIDILVNNSGISQRSRADESSLAIDRKIMEVNYFGTIALTKAVLPHMIKNGGGQIAVTSSVVGKFGFPLRSAYSASKHALHGFFESLRAENTQNNIKITMVIPGRVKTNISFHAITKDGTEHGVMDPGQENGMPAEVCAEKILNALRKNKKEVNIGRKELLMLHIRRFLPFLYYRIAGKIAPK